MSRLSFDSVLTTSWNMLERFYENPTQLNLLDYVRLSEGSRSQVLFDEDLEEDTLFIAAEFPSSLKQHVETCNAVDLQTLSLVSEELSHLFHLVHAALSERQVSVFQLECVAEIDRFICFLHWNSFCPQFPLPVQFTNCHQVCDVLFEARSFETRNESLYREAESFAFYHLRNAFSHVWSQRKIDTTQYDPIVKSYLTQLCQPDSFRLKTA